MKTLPLLTAMCLLCCCKTDPASDPTAANDAPATQPTSAGIQPLPATQLQRLRDSVTHIDYVFYEQSFSMSMDEAAGVDYALAGISEAPPVITNRCPAIGRAFYKIGGRTVEEADIHFASGCTYLAFAGPDKRPTYGNAFTEQGKSFFNGQFGQLVPGFTPVE